MDEINDTEEIVVKPLSKQLKSISCFAGATIMGDGKVALILDILGLAQRASLAESPGTHAMPPKTQSRRTAPSNVSPGCCSAWATAANLPCRSRWCRGWRSSIRKAVEISGNRQVVQYRGEIMPLVHIADALQLPAQTGREGPMQVVVHSEGGQSVGLVVDEILDIVDQHVTVTRKSEDARLLGSAVIQQHVTDLLECTGTGDVHRRRGEDRMSATQQQFCTFIIQGLLFGVEVETVQEVIRHQEMTGVPLAPAVVAGLINLRGQIVTAIDLRRRLGVRDRLEGELPMNVVVRTGDGAVSLLVDEIGDVVEVEESNFEATPDTLASTSRELIRGVYKLKNELLLVLDTQRSVNIGTPAGDSRPGAH